MPCPTRLPTRRQPPARPRAALLATLLGALMVAGCATPLPPLPPIPGDLVLLGEVHDNAVQHALRAQWLRERLAAGARPALLMEQLDRAQQPAIDALLATLPPPGAGDAADAAAREAVLARLVVLGGGERAGWDWALYRPYLQLALQYRLPLVAANVSRTEARQVMQQGLAASGFEATVPEALLAAQAEGIVRSHCGQIGQATAQRMALAQVARDQAMARLVAQYAAAPGRGVVLLAGNGHVRRDLGVPQWLPQPLRAQVRAVGFVERDGPAEAADDDPPEAFDQRVTTPPQPREDPCAAMRAPAPASAPRQR